MLQGEQLAIYAPGAAVFILLISTRFVNQSHALEVTAFFGPQEQIVSLLFLSFEGEYSGPGGKLTYLPSFYLPTGVSGLNSQKSNCPELPTTKISYYLGVPFGKTSADTSCQ